ncbi:MAG: EscJ/YscJ/HrcJ family type III secretion inner membrane ring protein [Verrucomicrobia bacterium]|nr:EscJ/YscJ/HrcJ family type III secretion inner membrane ring protein [Verrucomicrobiota bacterium]
MVTGAKNDYHLHHMKKLKSSWFFIAFTVIIALAMTACESKSSIVHGLDEQDANEIMVLLEKENIPAYKMAAKATGGAAGSKVILWDIAVSGTDKVQAMAILSANGLPRTYAPVLLDLFTASGLVPSDMAEKIRYEAGLAASLATTIRKIDGVVDANVIISFPEENPLNPTETKRPITAAVFVKHTGVLDDPNSHIINKIKELVSSAVSGLTYGNVTVVADRSMLSLPLPAIAQQSPREYLEVWGFVIAKSSLFYFQVLFFCISIVMCVLMLGVIWSFWKIYPILKKSGGVRALFSLKPLPDEYEKKLEQPAEEIKEEKPSEEPKEPRVQENVEE